MRLLSKTILLLTAIVLVGCSSNSFHKKIVVHNNLDIARETETVEISKTQLGAISNEDFQNIVIKDSKSGDEVKLQFINTDKNKFNDIVLFQTSLEPNSLKEFIISINKEPKDNKEQALVAYSRFVPERVDDYAWENDKVAFRTYGPEAERLTKLGVKGGTLSSGIDCWLKKVEYPIINKWYKKHSDKTGSYHEDTGEGLDNYHVGTSRGCGGIGVWQNDSLYVSGNFTSHSTISNGCIRTSFDLDYNEWNAGGTMVSESKHISLDAGSNLTRHEIIFSKDVKNVVCGLALPKNIGEITIDEKTGVFTHWGEHHGSELGIALVINPENIYGHHKHIVDKKDESHLLVHVSPVNGKIIYYSGFGWKESGQFNSQAEWVEYLNNFSTKLASPLRIEVKK